MPTSRRPSLIALLCFLAACGGEQEGDGGTTDPSFGGSNSVGGQGVGGAMTGGAAGSWITPGGSAGTAGTMISLGGSTGGSTTIMPPECLVDWTSGGSSGISSGSAGTAASYGAAGSATTAPPTGASADAAMMPIPYSTFNIINTSTSTLYFRNNSSCQIDLKIYSCADGFLEPVDYLPGCMASCSLGSNICVSCEMCAPTGTVQGPYEVTSITWDGTLYERNYASGGCGCYNQFAAPYGMYRAELTVYADSNLQAIRQVSSTNFYYQGPGTVVTLTL